MKRRNFIERLTYAGAGLSVSIPACVTSNISSLPARRAIAGAEAAADAVIIGGGLGGCAAALAACRNGLRVIMTEETDWLGGQIAQQGVPPDEHQWIETHGAPQSYRDYRNRVRDYYRRNYPLTDEARARELLNPGDGAVSRICHEPRVCVAVLLEMLNPYLSSGQLQILTRHKIKAAEGDGDEVQAVELINLETGDTPILTAPYFIDATELGDLLPLTGTEYVTGTEARSATGELHAPEKGNPRNHQAFTLCFAMDYRPGEDHTIDRPANYDHWSTFQPTMDPPWPGPLIDLDYSNPRTLQRKELGFHPEGIKTGDMLNLWNYRRIINRHNFRPGTYPGDVTVVNWPQNDYFPGNLIDVDEATFQKHVEDATQLNLSLLYWLQTEAPRPDGGTGWPGIRLRKDIMGTASGMAKYPYIRESRRIKAEFTVLEEHVGAENRKLVAGPEAGKTSAAFADSVGTGYYHIDLHPSTEGDNYIDFGSLPFQIPLGALLPVRMNNLLPANKNIGTTHITNGCFRLHPVEWSIGEAVGLLVSFSLQRKVIPRRVRQDKGLLAEFQTWIRSQGLETHW
ncbi:FAD-dependent oxidoreductase [Flavilitoribacter nigricans]|uniref:FAD-dependent oxidoreductase n=1 Tax=Flavilitoribacter nigricans (strain ATCC 23147 / DSM 23189 / NBRC 102662 / NCIMB 1420 / SS-2) TaxID=1122177 RepID=A0A2D0N8G5_FLAN2|nr:FAD-dependent oxidoreductase [Flavilitoribacter nigricans]PHN04680.1 FAD-dependent oxidoreductase [Flavilitoribacter nigricans DSM 23189 = NBRC 102662]